MRHHRGGQALRIALSILILYGQGQADTASTWVGLTASWSNPLNWNPVGASNGAVSVTIGLGGAQPVLDVSASIDNLNLNGATLTTSAGNVLTVSTANTGGISNINNAGTLVLNPGAGTTALLLAGGGTVNLNGSGTVNMGGPNSFIYASNFGMTLNNNSTIQGAGSINRIGTAFAFNNNSGGVVNANQTGGIVLGNSVTNAGLLEATNGSTLTLFNATIGNTSGTINAAGAGSTVQLNGANISGGTLQGSGGGQFQVTGGSTLSNTVAVNGPLTILNGNSLTLDTTSGPVTVNIGTAGALNLNSTGSSTDLILNGAGGNVTINGPGGVTLSNNVNNRIYANSTGMTLNNNTTLQGSGQIGVVGQGFTFVNGGTVNANQSAGLSLGGTIVNNGILEATNGGALTLASGTLNNSNQTISATGANSALVFNSQNVTNAGGTIQTTGGAGNVTLNNTTINGGTLLSNAGGTFQVTGSSALGGGAVALNGIVNVGNGASLQLNTGGTTFALSAGSLGQVNLNSTGSTSDLILAGSGGTVNLNGPVTMSASTSNRIYALNGGMTLNNNSTIQGAGQFGTVGQGFTFNNNATGVVTANSPGLALSIGSPTTNAGLLQATNGGILSLTNQTFNNTGGTIAASGTGSIVQLNSTGIIGGTLQTSGGGVFNATGSPTLSQTVNLNGLMNVTNGSALLLNAATPMTLNIGAGGGLNLNSAGSSTDLFMSGTNGTVNLNGPVTLSNNASNRIYANSTGMTLNSSGTIQGAGQIGAVGQPFNFNNTGTVNANQSAGLSLRGTITNTAGILQATNGGTLTLGGTVNNTGSTITANGVNTGLNLISVTVTNTNGLISASGTGSSLQLNGANIQGGSVQATGGAQMSASGSYSTLGGTLALNGVLNVANGSGIYLDTTGGPMTLNMGPGSGINLNSSGSATDLALLGSGGTVNLNGPVTLSNNASNRIYANGTGMTLNNNSTIQGAGGIGQVGQPFNFNNNVGGVVNSNAGTLTIGGTISNAGLFEATNGFTLSLTGANVTNTGAGTIGANGAGSAVLLNGATITGGTLQAVGGGQFSATGTNTLNGTVALNGPLNIVNGNVVTLNTTGGPMTLNIGAGGALNLNSTGSATDLALAGTNGVVNLNGPVTLSNSANNRIYAANGGMSLNSSGTIQGAGQIGLVGQPFNFNNTGTVNANQSAGLSLGGAVTNTSGLLQATNGSTLTLSGSVNNTGSTITANGANTTVKLVNDIVTNTNGVISANGAGSSVQLNGATIRGGTLEATAGGVFTQSGGYSSLGGGTLSLNGPLTVANGSGIYLDASSGSMTLNMGAGGGINLNSTGAATDIALTGSGGTVNLNGPVTLSANANNRIYANNGGMTLNNNSTIQGQGQIGVVGSQFQFNNNNGGIVNANSGTLFLNAPTANTGLLEATNGATLSLGGITVANNGGTVAATGSTVQLNGTTINGGALQSSGGGLFTTSGTPILKGTIALNGVVSVGNGNALTMDASSGPMTLNMAPSASVSLNASGTATDLVLSGTGGTVNLNGGFVDLDAQATNRIYAANAGMTLNNASTIDGAGQIGGVGNVFTLQNAAGGSVIATQSLPLVLGSAVTLTNSGTLQSISGATLEVQGAFTNYSGHTLTGGTYVAAGIIEFTNADVDNNAADIVMIGSGQIQDQSAQDGLRHFNDNTASGSFALEGGADFTASGAFTNAGSVDIFTNDLFTAALGPYTQTSGTTDVDGTLTDSAVNIDGGVLMGTGTVNGNVTATIGGVVAPGDSPGTLTIQGDYTQSATGVLDLEIGGSGAGQFDVLNITGAAALSGTLDIATLAGFTPFNGETFDVMNYASRTGTFSTVNGLDLGNGYQFQLQYNSNDLLLVVNGSQAAPEAGTWMLMAAGFGLIVARCRRRKGQ